MVYGFVLIGSLLVGAVYWIITTCRDEDAHELMWSPGSGLIEPEPWLQSVNGGYTGWSPGSSAYAAWSPGAYFNLFTPTTIIVPTTRTTTQRTRRTRRTRLPPELPGDLTGEMVPTPNDGPSENRESPLSPFTGTSPDSDEKIPPSDPEPSFDEDKKPPGLDGRRQLGPPPPPTTLAPMNYDDVYGLPRFWKAKDENEEAYEENPQDLVNTRPPDKLPVGGWGYDYENTA